MKKPDNKPACPNFSSGPCAKRPGWSVTALKGACIGRSHRSGPGKAKLKAVIDLHRELLNIPEGYFVGIVPASDTGAVEMALWSLLGERGVDVLAWESFSTGWMKDIKDHIKPKDLRVFEAGYGAIPDLSEVDTDRDVVFVWNGTTSGVRVPHTNWIKADRRGLTICDATSAVFAYEMAWDKLDVVTWSWQKVLGGEAAHGMIVLSPRAVERLENYTPDRAMPKIFSLTKKGKLNKGIFEGATINTPSMLAVEDCIDALKWVSSIGGVSATVARCKANLSVIETWVEKTDWVDFLPLTDDIRSRTSVCLNIVDPWFTALSDEKKAQAFNFMIKALDDEGVAYDIKNYRDAPMGLRIWAGATVEEADLKALMPWLDWAFSKMKKSV